MKAGILLLILAVLFIAAAFNVGMIFDAAVVVYQNSIAREAYAMALGLIGFCLGAMALALISRAARAQVEADFPEHGIGAADVETIKRNQQ